MENGILPNAIKSLYQTVTRSTTMKENEKHVLIKLIEKLAEYYKKRYNEIIDSTGDRDRSYQVNKFVSEMTDYIVIINDTIKGKNDVFSVANMIYKEMNYDTKKGFFKRKRLI